MSDSKFPQVSRTLLSILVDLSNAVVWMVSTRPLISKSSNFFITPLGIIPSAPITTGFTVIIMFHFFRSLARSKYLSLFLLSFIFTQWSAKSSVQHILFVFSTSSNWWFVTGVWVKASLFRSTVFFQESSLILALLWSGWSRYSLRLWFVLQILEII